MQDLAPELLLPGKTVDLKRLATLVHDTETGFTQWYYRTKDVWPEVMGRGYWNDAAPLVRVGDLIIVRTGHGTSAAVTTTVEVFTNHCPTGPQVWGRCSAHVGVRQTP